MEEGVEAKMEVEIDKGTGMEIETRIAAEFQTGLMRSLRRRLRRRLRPRWRLRWRMRKRLGD